MEDYTKKSLAERMEYLYSVFSSEDFRQLNSQNRETYNYICPFAPAERDAFLRELKTLQGRLKSEGITVLEINLYDLCLKILEDEDVLSSIQEEESTWEKEELLEMLKGLLSPREALVPRIAAEAAAAPEHQLLFITGIGEVYPYVRTHSLLESLQAFISRKPTVLFFPGDYKDTAASGLSLELFGLFPNDRYYRAHNIYHFL